MRFAFISPLTMSQGEKITLHMLLSGSYHPVLLIPPDDFSHFSVRPLKWLRYVAYTIYGREGFLSTSASGGEIQDHDAPLQHTNYYFHSNDEPLWLDPSAMDDRTTNSSTSSSTGRVNFRDALVDRDGSCIMIQVSPGSCEAAHIIPHSKGNKYITKLHPRHHINLQPPLNDINDVRNGILIYIAFHHHLGLSEIAFLRTPNFAMATSDVPAVSFDPGLTARESRITMQYFTAHWKAVELRAAPHNSDARLSLQSQDFPTTLLLDYVYGCAALKKWANHDFYESLKTLARDDFYNNEASEDGVVRDDLSCNGSADDENGRGKFRSHISSNNQKQVKQRKHAPRNKVNKARRSDSPTIQDMVMTLWLLNAKKARSRKDAENPDLNGIREKVEHWRRAVE